MYRVCIVGCLALLSGCSMRGNEGGRCFPNGTCNAGLTCASDRCVLLPDGDASSTSDADTDSGPGTDSGSADVDSGVSCGDGLVEGLERCDGADLGGQSCGSLGQGFTGGSLACTGACEYDTSACTVPPGCGDGVIGGAEQCDGGDFGGMTCITLGFAEGTLTCAAGCIFDPSGCFTCGDGLVQPTEVCDGSATGGVTCASLGFGGGTLSCAADCLSLDPSTCTGGPPTVPVLRLPMNNAYTGSPFVTGSRRPTFVWEASTLVGGGTIDYALQYSTSPTFASGLTLVSTTATDHQPAADLAAPSTAPVGSRYYWRVQACNGPVCSAYSMTWWVNVGRSDRDFDGDGYADVVGGAQNYSGMAGQVLVFRGGAGATFDAVADLVLDAPAVAPSSNFGNAVASAGDVNGDGFSDLLVGAFAGTGYAFVYMGGAAFFTDTTPDGTLAPAPIGGAFGWSVAPAGDLDADGFDDIVVGARLSDVGGTDSGEAYVFYGGAGPTFDATAEATLVGSAGDDMGVSGGGGDFNGDGYSDLAIGAWLSDGPATDSGRIAIYFGGPGGALDTVANGQAYGTGTNDTLGFAISVSDLDGDGFADLLTGAHSSTTSTGDLRIFRGGPGATFEPTADATYLGTSVLENFGRGVGCLGDVNGDAYPDVAGSAPNGMTGVVRVYFGASGALPDTAADGTAMGVALDCLGYSMAGAGDVDGDALMDLVAGAPCTSSGTGALHVFLGGTGPFFDVVADMSALATAGAGSFGASVY